METDRKVNNKERDRTMKTTVIIPNFNGKTFLYNCLISLQKCVPQDFDILVVDNGSTDGSVEMMNESFPKIHLILLNSNRAIFPMVLPKAQKLHPKN